VSQSAKRVPDWMKRLNKIKWIVCAKMLRRMGGAGGQGKMEFPLSHREDGVAGRVVYWFKLFRVVTHVRLIPSCAE